MGITGKWGEEQGLPGSPSVYNKPGSGVGVGRLLEGGQPQHVEDPV